MLLSPVILALLLCSTVACGLTVAAAGIGFGAVLGWNHEASGRLQLLRERRWFLVETSLRLILGLQLFSLLVFIAAADHLKALFTGAMCAVGTLNASPFGMPALAVKTAAFILCGLWLVTDRASRAAATTGLVRFKTAFLVFLACVLVADAALQIRYFADLDPEIITSCCATVFDQDAGGVAAGIAAMSVSTSKAAFFVGLVVTVAAALWAIRRHRLTIVYSILAVAFSLVTAVAVVTWIAPSFYELPTHHCPLCLLAGDYGYVGYPLYLLMATAVIAGAGSGLLHVLRSIDLSRCILIGEERRLCAISAASFVAVAVIAVWPLVTSPFRLEGY
jgi:hypothetical protein